MRSPSKGQKCDRMLPYSFLMSVYKKEDARALSISVDSMLKQTWMPDQIVIVKDGPLTEKLDAVLLEYETKHGDIFTVVGYEENKGLAYALNFGLKACRNEFVARMDSDDYSVETRCEKQISAFENDPELVLVGTNMQYFQDSIENISEDIRVYPADDKEIKKALRRYSPFSHPSVMFKRSEVLACGGYDETLRRRQDIDLFSRLIVHNGKKAANIQEPLILFRRDESYYSRNKNKESCNNRISVQKKIYKRGDCRLTDYLYVWTIMTASKLMPNGLYGLLYSKMKNKKQ